MLLPNSKTLEINKLASVFNNTTATYKFYWFVSILEILIKKNKTTISFWEIICAMIAQSWYPIHYFRISFGKSDKLFEQSKLIQETYNIPIDINKDELLEFLQSKLNDGNLKSLLNIFTKYVPYRFLNPWMNCSDNKIVEQKSRLFFNDCIYSIEEKIIKINPNWTDYLVENYQVLKDFAFWNLTLFLQKRNPNVPDIPNKLIKPIERESLSAQHKLWDKIIEIEPIRCIYTNKILSKKDYDLDHFVPWSFVSHNLFWNLIPSDSSINSSKSNNLPDLDLLLRPYSEVHHKALRICVSHNFNDRILEDYLSIYDDYKELAELSDDGFYNVMRRQFSPMVQIAENMGFKTWRI